MILVFGSLNMDLVLQAPAIPRPGETVLGESYETKPGGKGNNQAVAATRAGAPVVMAGAVGDDAFGRSLLDNLRAEGIDATAVVTADRPTGIAMITVDPAGENAIAVAAGANRSAAAGRVDPARLGPGTTVLMQMEVPPGENAALAAKAAEAGARVVLNVAPAAPVDRATLDALSVLVVNEGEAIAVAGHAGLPADDAATAARALAMETGTICVVTLGGEGALAVDGQAGGAPATWRVGALSVRPVDTTGAGDTFTGVLAAALDAGSGLAEALRRASVGAALACTGLGAQESMPDAAAIDAALDRLSPAERID
ncbi:MAG: ribokinase [Azospirillaceae bacterium]